MTDIKTYIKSGEAFIPIADYDGPIDEPFYIEGAIELVVGTTKLIDEALWDDVNHLWCYLVQGMASVMDGKDFSSFFPDQPIRLTLLPNLADRTLTIVVKVDLSVSATTSLDEFASAFVCGGREFFAKLFALLPRREAEFYTPQVELLAQIEKKIIK